jgi:dephospho-CoA kinase
VPRPLAVAVTGGIGAGKSQALRSFAQRGVPVLSADEVVHRLLQEDEEVRAALQEHFGDQVLDRREALAEIVFQNRDELAWLEGLLHPRVAEAELAWHEKLAALPEPPPVAVTEVPLLYETGADERFDAVVVVTAPEAVRRARSQVDVDGRSDRLIPDDEKVRRADFAYVNDGSLEELDAFVADVLERLAERT